MGNWFFAPSIPEGPPLRIVLIGKTGAGKSASGNTILGRKAFEAVPSSRSVTHDCQTASINEQREILVVDTPGILDPDVDWTAAILNCITVSAPGPHVFLLVIPVGHYTREERSAVEALQEVFGERAKDYMMILFTRGDDLDGITINTFVTEGHPKLLEMINSCRGRYHVLNNKSSDRTQVVELVKKIDDLLSTNAGGHFSEEMIERQPES